MVHRYSTRLVVAATLALSVGAAAEAATLDGAAFRLDYMFPDTSTIYLATDGPIFGTVGPGTDATIVVEGVTSILLDFNALSLEVLFETLLTSPTWNSVAFNGVRITFTDLPGKFSAFDLEGNSLSPVTPSFTDTELFINWSGAGYDDGDTASFSIGLAPVPLPAGLPLLIAGLGVMGAVGLRQRRKPAA